MNASSQYDDELQMYVEQPREPDLSRLRFLRWLVESGQLGQGVAGASSGEFAIRVLPRRRKAA